MHQLRTEAEETTPIWTTVAEGIDLLLKPGGTDALLAARREVRLAVRADPDIDTGIPFVFGFVCWGAEDWRGIGEKPDDAPDDAPLTPVPFSTEALGRLLRQRPDIYQRLDDEYVGPVLELLSEKKRIVALAEWHFGGGPAYCDACPERREDDGDCPVCPYRENEPRSLNGERVWTAIRACQGQLRVGMAGAYGLDFPAVIQTAALGGPMSPLCALLLSEVLPAAEQAIVASLRKDDEE